MRVEVRVERDEHEYSVTIECDQRTTPMKAIGVATSAMEDLMGPQRLEDLPAYFAGVSDDSRTTRSTKDQ